MIVIIFMKKRGRGGYHCFHMVPTITVTLTTFTKYFQAAIYTYSIKVHEFPHFMVTSIFDHSFLVLH